LVLDALGVERLELVTGGSLGAMVGQCLAALAPDRVGRLALFGGCTTASPWIVGFNHVGGHIIRSMRDRGDAERGLELARQLAMLTYRAEPGLEDRQARSGSAWSATDAYPVGSWLDHHGKKLRARFDPAAYLCLIGAMSHHDVRRRPPAPEDNERWRRGEGEPTLWVRASTIAVGIDTDNLYLPHHMAELAAGLRDRGVVAEHHLLTSRHGHDAFLIEWPQVRAFLALAWALPAAWVAAPSE
jgi:homoserine O-acetyltransferase